LPHLKISQSKVRFPHIVNSCPHGKTHSEVDNVLIDRRRHFRVLDDLSFRAACCNTDYYLLVAKVRETLAVIKQRSYRFYMERFSLQKLNRLKSKQLYRVEDVSQGDSRLI
jgi:hypothetical protein